MVTCHTLTILPLHIWNKHQNQKMSKPALAIQHLSLVSTKEMSYDLLSLLIPDY